MFKTAASCCHHIVLFCLFLCLLLIDCFKSTFFFGCFSVPATIKSLTGNVTVNETNPIDLRCDVYGHPVPAIKWKKDGKELQQPTGKNLRIDSSTRTDRGKYTCTARNVVRMVDMETFVTVNCK